MNVDSPLLVRAGQALTVRLLEPRLNVVSLAVPVHDLPSHLDGFLIGHLSDLHVGKGPWRPSHLATVLQVLSDAQPRLVVNTGDYIYREPPLRVVGEVARAVVEVTPRAVHLGILGNHDYYAGEGFALELATVLGKAGVDLLFNRTRTMDGLSVTGLTVDEPGADWDSGVDALLASPRPRLVLLHEPDLAHRLPRGSADLVLSGHTHGGQIVLPGLRGWTVRRYSGSSFTHGRYEVGGNRLYVNRGLGHTGIPVRFRATPELTLLRLCRDAGTA